ncbi:hypothetical protein HGM15179_016301 [Zosterops borbonicus]|uniref:Uncharacterized protein n=1 Tax=Zosterops borbonicus TaxID=364589 RepID=A0A8K1G3E3_9PASS|nr:hypothetical protein HGM15179_016301 [Zosterops borbonicus]
MLLFTSNFLKKQGEFLGELRGEIFGDGPAANISQFSRDLQLGILARDGASLQDEPRGGGNQTLEQAEASRVTPEKGEVDGKKPKNFVYPGTFPVLSRPLFKISQQGIAAQSKSGIISDVGDGNTQERSKGIGAPQGQVDHEEFGKLREKLG